MHIQHIKSPDCPSHYNHYLSIYLQVKLEEVEVKSGEEDEVSLYIICIYY